jgi:glycosyltransferase involved in cell wall biosynthesis
MLALVKRCAIATEDRLKYSPLVRGALSRYQRWTDRGRHGDQQALAHSIHRLCAAARLAASASAVQAVQHTIHQRLALLQPRRVDWTAFVDHIDDPRIPRSAILKPYLGPREKGVLFISFEKEWFKLLAHCDLQEFNDRYFLVVSPSGSPHNIVNYVFAAAYPGKVFTLISNAGDQALLPRVGHNFVVVPLYASHWVLPELFQPLPLAERDVDLCMVANFAKFKRHFALFQALRRMPKNLRVLLIGQDQDGRTAATIQREAAYYGVADRFTVQGNLSYSGVSAALCRARASVILSRREGSCVVVAESLFADAPASVLETAEIGSRAFINPATGRFLHDGRLAEELTELVERAGNYRPRAWAEHNISCYRSTASLNDLLRQHALADGQQWTQDLVPLCWRPDPALVRPADVEQMQAARRDMQERFGIEVGPVPAT